jgi:hypothetical protein
MNAMLRSGRSTGGQGESLRKFDDSRSTLRRGLKLGAGHLILQEFAVHCVDPKFDQGGIGLFPRRVRA